MENESKHIDIANPNIELLYKFNLSNKNSLKLFNKSTRDNDNLKVLKCANSGVIILERYVLPESYYEENVEYGVEFRGTTKTIKGSVKSKPLDDDIRRFKSYKELIKGSDVLDFGCGRGDFVQLSNKISKRTVGLEINSTNREYVNSLGIQCVETLPELNEDKFDLITLNHVFEHLNEPINTLVKLRKYLKDEGMIVIEIPHARDILLETFDLEAYKKFTLWSEHLILHTRKSLEAYVMDSGLNIKSIEGAQRYPISNHFNWLLNGKPGGHDVFSHLNDDGLHNQYTKFLNSIDQTDTLIGYFTKDN